MKGCAIGAELEWNRERPRDAADCERAGYLAETRRAGRRRGFEAKVRSFSVAGGEDVAAHMLVEDRHAGEDGFDGYRRFDLFQLQSLWALLHARVRLQGCRFALDADRGDAGRNHERSGASFNGKVRAGCD